MNLNPKGKSIKVPSKSLLDSLKTAEIIGKRKPEMQNIKSSYCEKGLKS